MWRHAESKLAPHASPLDLADAILWLNRAVAKRVKSISVDYSLRVVARELGIRKSSQVEVLARMGLVRPRMLQELIALRNAVEHEDAMPPTLARCQEISEFVWYFLRSTDAVARLQPLDLDFSDDFSSDFVSLDFEGQGVVPSASGALSLDRVSWVERSGWTRIEPTEKPRIRAGSLWWQGMVRGPQESPRRIWQLYFDLNGSITTDG